MILQEEIYAASERNESATRLQAVSDLKLRRLEREDATTLCDNLQGQVHPAERTAMAQLLGYHGAGTRFAEVGAALHHWALQEEDVITLRALMFALRGCEGVVDFLGHGDDGVVLEAVISAPTSTQSLQALLQAAFEGLPEGAFHALCCRLGSFDDIVSHVVAFFMTAEFKETGQVFHDRVQRLFGVLPQADLFDALADRRGELERSYKTIWPGIWQRERQRRLLEQFVVVVGENGVAERLIESVLHRVVMDEESHGHYRRFVRALLVVLNTKSALGWVAACDQLGQNANREVLSRLAETLITLCGCAPLIVEEAQAVLAKWEPQLPGVRMKAFHATRESF